MTLKPCLDCGQPCPGTRCDQHRGYDRGWRVLSARARRLQPWCEDCGSVDNLTADHSPEAWARRAARKPIRLQDISVVCQPCNNARGQARPESVHEKRCRTTTNSGGKPLTSAFPPRASRTPSYT